MPGDPCDHRWVYKLSKKRPGTWIKHCRKCGVQRSPDRGLVYPFLMRAPETKQPTH